VKIREPALLAMLVFASSAQAQISEPVQVDGGLIAGQSVSGTAIRAFKGVPFAAPPVGELRWKPPQPVPAWNGVRQVDAFGPDCPQLASRTHPQSEDCLFLNVWTEAQSADEKRPVMVWIYGGGYRAGSTTIPAYDGTGLARRGVVFVSIAYRVGPLGFMAHPELSAESPRRVSGNYGLLDQIAALDWVRRNIASFGGDPDRITIFGQSAGSISTSYLAASPLATGKFHRLIGQTGGGFGLLAPEPLASAEHKGLAFGQSLDAETIAQLRAVDAGRLVHEAGTVSGRFQPINDGWVVPGDLKAIYQEGRQNDVAMLVGSNSEEEGESRSLDLTQYRENLRHAYGALADDLFALHPASSDEEARASARMLGTLALGDYTMYTWATSQVATGRSPVYSYRFTHAPPIPPEEYPGGPDASPPGAWHGAEIRYALDNLGSAEWPWSETDHTLANRMASYWVNFAATGDPNGPGLPHWPTMQEQPAHVMQLSEKPRAIPRPGMATLDVLRRHFTEPRKRKH
jgi:para-nitrobenzyl esterase